MCLYQIATQDFALAVKGPYVLFFKIDLGAMLLQLADGRQAVDRVSCKPADRLCENEPDAACQRILHHAVETVAPAGRCSGDAFVYLNAIFDTMQIGLLRHNMPGKGLISWAFAVQSSPFGGTVNSLFPLFSFVYLECRAESTYPPLD